MKLLSDQIYVIAGFAGVLLLILAYFYLYNNTLNIEDTYEHNLHVSNNDELLNYIIKYADMCFLKYHQYSQEKKCYKLIIYLDEPFNFSSYPIERNIKNLHYYLKYDILQDNKNIKTLIISYVPNLENNQKGVYIYEVQ